MTATVENDGTTEDCLFLDVHSPKTAFNKTGGGYGNPVLVYIHGGGYVAGSKDDFEFTGMTQRAAMTGEPLVFVSLNYRLGSLGFMGGQSVQQDGVANAGLHDQLFALQCVRRNIHFFGGDPDRVTVWGGSAGAGSIIQQLTVGPVVVIDL